MLLCVSDHGLPLLHFSGMRPDLNVVPLVLFLLFKGFAFLPQHSLVEAHNSVVVDFFALLQFCNLVFSYFLDAALGYFVQNFFGPELALNAELF